MITALIGLLRYPPIVGLFVMALGFASTQAVLAETKPDTQSKSTVAAQTVDWPQEITAEEGTIVVYQPQPEKLTGNNLQGRAAMSIEPKGGGEIIFGAFWFTAQLDTDTDDGTVLVHDFKVTRVSWPDSQDAGEQRFTQIVEATVPKTGFLISRERLAASLASAAQERKSLENLKTDPPKIVFKDTPSVLLLYDGEPRFSAVENSDYERVLNTPFVVVRNKKTKTERLELRKFNPALRRYTLHREVK